MEHGFDPDAFWRLTPRLYVIQMQGALARIRGEARARIEAAWLTAMLSRATRIPPLEQLLRGPEGRPAPEELRAEMRALSNSLPKRTWKEWRSRM
ncbi:hypothetical protein [Halodurantibacterium flavum]|uniref:Phage tail assembly chaperone n=1 Tax=Halodurantibacterium flavum TaxID=1382802 RepID=A0ABW4S886_9RHOB